MIVRWVTQKDKTDADGFLLEDEAAFAAEQELLAHLGCPDLALARLVTVEVIGRDESETTAGVSPAMAEWLERELDAEVEKG